MTTQEGVIRKQRRTPAEIEQIVSEFAGSGLNQSQFCQQRGVNPNTLSGYLRRRREDGVAGNRPTALLPVELRAQKTKRDGEVAGLVVVLANGRRIEVGASFDAVTVQRLVQALETR